MSSRDRRGTRPRTAAELMTELQRNPEFVASQQRLEDDRHRHIEEYRFAARGVLADLAASGLQVATVGDLRRLGRKYPEAIPVLVRWLPKVHDPRVKEDIVRTLSVPWAREAASLLVSEFEQAQDSTGAGLRWAIGSALEVLANDDIADDLIRLATSSQYGMARQMVVVGLGKLKDARAVDVLVNLLDDEEVLRHVVMALGMLRAKTARSRIEPLLEHPKSWIRKEAKKALARIG